MGGIGEAESQKGGLCDEGGVEWIVMGLERERRGRVVGLNVICV